jgi:orotidine-5'-phosphate decarboxylase
MPRDITHSPGENVQNFADRLLEAIDEKGSPVCVGLDPVYDRLPAALKRDGADEAAQIEAIRIFCLGVLEAIAPHVPAVKPQSAYFEAYRGPGAQLYFDMVAEARRLGLLVIGDIKRNDIGSTAAAYAAGHLGAQDSADAVTVNGYLGADGIEPFAAKARDTGRGLFVLVRTSNPSASQLQDIADASGTKLFEHAADMVAGLGEGEGLIGQRGYSSVGAVVGATWPQEAKMLRERMARQIFLVPGYGAQGASAADCAASFKADGTGAIVNASRSVLQAHASKQYARLDWPQAIERAAKAFAADIAQAVGR